MMDRRITIQQATETADSMGTAKESWSTYITRWAEIMSNPAGSEENYDSDTKVDYRKTNFRIRYDNESKLVTPLMRIIHDGNTFDIESVQEDTTKRRRRFLLIEAVRKSNLRA